MLHKGPIPRFVHGLLEYLAGVLLIGAPFVIDFDKDSATAAAIVLGLLLITLAAITEGITGIVNQLGIQAHAVLDIVVAVVLVASPFVFGFSGDGEPTALFIILGVAHLLISIGTRYYRER
jgi:hypothetical protein